jgi:hypothetical protein
MPSGIGVRAIIGPRGEEGGALASACRNALTRRASSRDRLAVPFVQRSLGVLLLAGLAHAPFQCAHDPPPDQRTEDDPAEAVYVLAEQFHVKGDEKARKEALEYLAKRYPKSLARDFDGNPARLSEADALIAYLQMLGTLVDFKLYDDKANIR